MPVIYLVVRRGPRIAIPAIKYGMHHFSDPYEAINVHMKPSIRFVRSCDFNKNPMYGFSDSLPANPGNGQKDPKTSFKQKNLGDFSALNHVFF